MSEAPPPPYVPDDPPEHPVGEREAPEASGRERQPGEAHRDEAAGEDVPPRVEPSASSVRPTATRRGEGVDPDEGLAREVAAALRDVPDFPRPGILFRDVMPVFADPALLRRVTDRLSREAGDRGAERIAGIESRGFLLAVPVALALDLPFLAIRKRGKLPGETESVSYELEYGSGHLEVQSDALRAGDRVVLVDDLLATGGTAAAAADLLEQLDGIVAGMSFLVELEELEGRSRLGRYNLLSLLTL